VSVNFSNSTVLHVVSYKLMLHQLQGSVLEDQDFSGKLATGVTVVTFKTDVNLSSVCLYQTLEIML